MSDSTKTRKSTKAMGWLAFACFSVVILAVEFLAMRGQVAFGRIFLRLDGWEVIACYAAIQGLMLATAALALMAVLSGDGYMSHRVFTGIFLIAACVASFLGARAAGWPTTGSLYTAGMSIAALRTWHALLRRIRRDTHPTTPMLKYPVLRFALARQETWAAAKLAYLDSLSPAEALATVRTDFPVPKQTANGVEVASMSKRDAWITAFAAVGSYDVSTAFKWLQEKGVKVDRSHGYTVKGQLVAQRRLEIKAVGA